MMSFETAPLGMPLWSAGALGALLLAAAIIDLRSRKVPNWLTYPAILIGLVGHALLGGLAGDGAGLGLVGAALGFAVGFFPLLLCWLAGGIGAGDAKLMGAVGALGGWRFALAAMVYGFLIAGLMAIIVMIRKRVVRRTLRRVLQTVVLLILPASRPADPTSEDSPKIPFAVALCLGAAAAMLEAAARPVLGGTLLGG